MLARVCSRSVRSFVAPSVGYSTASLEDKTVDKYLNKKINPVIEDAETKSKRFLRGVHPSLVQSKAWEKMAVSSTRQGADTHHPGQHPELTKAINQAHEVDANFEALMSSIAEGDPLREQTSHFQYGNYRKGDEDSILKMKMDWDFYSKVIPDSQFVEGLKASYEEEISKICKDAETEDPIPEEIKVFERFMDQMEEENEVRLEPYFATMDDLEYDLKNVPVALEEIIHDWDLVKAWVSAPRAAAQIQNRIDNNMWEMDDESTYVIPEKTVR